MAGRIINKLKNFEKCHVGGCHSPLYIPTFNNVDKRKQTLCKANHK